MDELIKDLFGRIKSGELQVRELTIEANFDNIDVGNPDGTFYRKVRSHTITMLTSDSIPIKQRKKLKL